MKKDDIFDNPKGGLLVALLAIAVMVVIIVVCSRPKIAENVPSPPETSMVEVDFKLFREALSEPCKLSRRGEFTCSEDMMNRVMQGVDTNAVKRNGNSIKLEKNGGYVRIPARMMVNLFDNNLLNTSESDN